MQFGVWRGGLNPVTGLPVEIPIGVDNGHQGVGGKEEVGDFMPIWFVFGSGGADKGSFGDPAWGTVFDDCLILDDEYFGAG